MDSKYLFVQMNKKIFLNIFLMLLFAVQVSAQPGPEISTLVIEHLYNSKLERINVPVDTALKIRTFILHKGAVIDETFAYQEILYSYQRRQELYGLAGLERMSSYDKEINLSYPGTDGIHRMYIIYKKDTMIVDFSEIVGPFGGRDHMDSLVIQKGYFKYDRSDDKYGCHQLGLTPFTKKYCMDYIDYDSTIDLSFLDERNQNALYFQHQALHYLSFHQSELALTSIAKAIEKNNGNKTCTTLQLLCEAYTQTAQYEYALEAISSAMYCLPYGYIGWHEHPSQTTTIDDRNYQTRIDLFIKLKQYDKALIDYDSLCESNKGEDYYDTRTNIDRADFKINYLKDYKGAIADLKEIINEEPDYTFCYYRYYRFGSDMHSHIYFSLAAAEYLNGEKQLAFRHWLLAEELGYHPPVATVASALSIIIHFDSIINQNITTPELYLARALVYVQVGKNYEWRSKVLNDILPKALNDINTAETLGMNDYKINMYRAFFLYRLKMYNEALLEIDLAISKDNTVPQCFDLRYKIRLELKQAKWNDDTDVDLIQLRKLAEDWTWEK